MNKLMDKTTDSIPLRIVLKQFVKGWYWFLLSFIVAALLISRLATNTVVGKAEYKMSVMTRFSEDKTLSLQQNDKMFWERTPPYDISQVFAILLSSGLIERAGNAVGYDIDYLQRDHFKTIDVYNDLPYKLIFLDAYPNDTFTLTATLCDGGVTLSDFNGSYQARTIHPDVFKPITLSMGDTLQSEIGRVVCLQQSVAGRYPHTPYQSSRPVTVVKVASNDAKTRFDKDMNLKITSDNSLLMEIAVQGSPRKIIEVLTKMVEICNEDIRSIMKSDLEENNHFIDVALQKIESSNEPPFVKEKERTLLLEKKARNESNMESLKVNHFIYLVDPPSMRPASSSAHFFKFFILLLALLIPSVIVYYTRLRSNRIFAPVQLPEQLQESIVTTIPLSCQRKRTIHSERLLLSLEAVRLKFPETKMLFIFGETKDKDLFDIKSLLEEDYKRAGRQAMSLHLTLPGKPPRKAINTIELKAGMLGSDGFERVIDEKYRNADLLLISADRSLSQMLMPYFNDFLFLIDDDHSTIKFTRQSMQALEELHRQHHGVSLQAIWLQHPFLSFSLLK